MNRLLIASLSALAFVQSLHAEDGSTANVGRAMTTAAQRFVASLNDQEAAKAIIEFDNPAREDWHNIPKDNRKGLRFGDMSAAQQALCRALLRSALSDSGYQKAINITSLENNLREGEKALKGAPLRDPDRYYLTIFGKPETKGSWGWSFEGHHLSLNFVIRDNQIISNTPSFWGANPATVITFVEGGPAAGTRTLGQEEQLAFDLLNELDATQKEKAIVADKAPKDYRAAGQPQPPQSSPEGLAGAEMTDVQRQTLLSLLEEYISHLPASLAQVRLDEIKAAGFDRVYFAWAGATKPGVGHYYRVQGPTFVLEFVNMQSDPAGNPANHIHSVWRSLKGDFAIPLSSDESSK